MRGAIPSTSVLGAILLTGYLGGAVATHVRVGDSFFTHDLFPTYLAVLIWGGLYLRLPTPTHANTSATLAGAGQRFVWSPAFQAAVFPKSQVAA
jgi:hypothetical protein